MSYTKKEHYISQYILKRFEDEVGKIDAVLLQNKIKKIKTKWKFPTCSGEYPARICDREVGDDNCPYCSNRKALSGVNTFYVNHKELMKEWDLSITILFVMRIRYSILTQKMFGGIAKSVKLNIL